MDKKLLALAVIEDAAQFARLVNDEQLPTLKPLQEVTVRRGVAGCTIESVLCPRFDRALSLLHIGGRLVVLAPADTRIYEGTPYAVTEKVVAMPVTPARLRWSRRTNLSSRDCW